MIIKTIKLTSLFVNTENYRFEPLSSQKEAIDKMVEDQEDKLYSLVDDIVTNGLSPVDLIIVTPSEDSSKYIVLEGNRRITSLKLLNNPTLIDDKYALQTKTIALLYDEEGKFGFACDAYYQVSSTKFPKLDPKSRTNIDSLGPSGGLMQALLVYEQITGCQLTKGLKIAGTGTIDIAGNAGLIGGIKQKIYIANACKVDIFFVPIDMSLEYDGNDETDPYSNWKEAQEAEKLLKKLGHTKMKIVPVKNLKEVVEYLEGLQ
jgi:hypothetical protein